jgi:hypothetical protein
MRVGEHVKFSSKFPKLAHCRGFVIEVDGLLAKVHWYEGDGPLHVLVANLKVTTAKATVC